MRTVPLKQAMMAGVCVLMVAGCSYPHPGPSLPEDDNALPSGAGATPTTVSPKPASKPVAKTVAKPTPTPTPTPAVKAKPTKAPKTSKTSSASSALPEPQPLRAEPVNLGGDAPQSVADSSPGEVAAGNAASPPPDSEADSGSGFDNLDIVDSSLKGKLAILRVGSEPTANNLLSVFAGLKNKTTHPLSIEVQTLYKDKVGSPLNDGSWIPMTLKPHEETEYRSASISADAADFLIRIRRARDAGGKP